MSGKLFFQIVLLMVIAIVLAMGAKCLKYRFCKKLCPYSYKTQLGK